MNMEEDRATVVVSILAVLDTGDVDALHRVMGDKVGDVVQLEWQRDTTLIAMRATWPGEEWPGKLAAVRGLVVGAVDGITPSDVDVAVRRRKTGEDGHPVRWI